MPGETSDGEGVLGYCWMHHFKCHSARTCDTWAKGGPITTDKVSEGWQERAFAKSEKKEAETFEADYDDDEDEHEMVHCSFCNDIIGTEEEVYDEESVEWYNANGETICPPCYKDWMKEYENDMDMRYTPFYADTVAFESFAGRWDVGQTKEIEGVQLTKVSNAYGRGNRRVGAGFTMEYEGHVGEIVANDEAGYRGQKRAFCLRGWNSQKRWEKNKKRQIQRHSGKRPKRMFNPMETQSWRRNFSD